MTSSIISEAFRTQLGIEINDDLIGLLALFVAAGSAPTDEEKLELLAVAMQVFTTWEQESA